MIKIEKKQTSRELSLFIANFLFLGLTPELKLTEIELETFQRIKSQLLTDISRPALGSIERWN